MIVSEVEGVDPRVNGTISRCQQLLNVDEIFFAGTLQPLMSSASTTFDSVGERTR